MVIRIDTKMSTCLRTISQRNLPVPRIVSTKSHSNQLSQKMPIRGNILEDYIRRRVLQSSKVVSLGPLKRNKKDIYLFEVSAANHLSFRNKDINTVTCTPTNEKQTHKYIYSLVNHRGYCFTNDYYEELNIKEWSNKSYLKITNFAEHKEELERVWCNHFEKNLQTNCHLDLSANVVKSSQPMSETESLGKPSEEQLMHVFHVLSRTMPNFFVQPLDYSIYNPNLIFVNNIRGVTTVGLLHYIKQVALLRTIGHLRFAYVKFDILKITAHPEDSSIKMRWRIKGVSGFKAFLMFWKIKLWKFKETLAKEQTLWYDGFSTFYVGADGLIHKHVADKVIPNQDKMLDDAEKAPKIATKIAILIGIVPQGVFNHHLLAESIDLKKISKQNIE